MNILAKLLLIPAAIGVAVTGLFVFDCFEVVVDRQHAMQDLRVHAGEIKHAAERRDILYTKRAAESAYESVSVNKAMLPLESRQSFGRILTIGSRIEDDGLAQADADWRSLITECDNILAQQ